MSGRKQYTSKVVTNIIHCMAKVVAEGTLSDEEIDSIPEEFLEEIASSLLAAREYRRTAAAHSFDEILEEAKKEVRKQFGRN